MSVNFCFSFCCNFYVCWLLSEFFLQFLCVLIFVSVFVAICECVDLSQFLQFLWVLICLRFLKLSVVFWTPLALKRGRRWAKGSQQWVAKWRSFSRSQHKLTCEPSLKKPGDFTVAEGHGHPQWGPLPKDHTCFLKQRQKCFSVSGGHLVQSKFSWAKGEAFCILIIFSYDAQRKPTG
jgi:hypothetical protein